MVANVLKALADVAAILTAVVAVYAYGRYRWILHSRMRILEKVLARKTRPNDNSLTLKQLAIAATLTEEQVIEAASQSKKIEPWAGQSGSEYRFRIRQQQQS